VLGVGALQERNAPVDLGTQPLRSRIDAGSLQIECRPVRMLGVAGGVGPGQYAVRPHASCELPEVGPRLLERGVGGAVAAAREQADTGSLGRLEP